MRPSLACLALFTAACGGSHAPTSPTAPPVSFPPGTYVLRIAPADPPVAPGSVYVCMSAGPTDAEFDIRVAEAEGGPSRVTLPAASGPNSGSLSGEIRTSGASVMMMLRGRGIDRLGVAVTFAGPSGVGDAVLFGTGAASTARGEVSGSLGFSTSALAAAACPLGWSIGPR